MSEGVGRWKVSGEVVDGKCHGVGRWKVTGGVGKWKVTGGWQMESDRRMVGSGTSVAGWGWQMERVSIRCKNLALKGNCQEGVGKWTIQT